MDLNKYVIRCHNSDASILFSVVASQGTSSAIWVSQWEWSKIAPDLLCTHKSAIESSAKTFILHIFFALLEKIVDHFGFYNETFCFYHKSA